MIATFLVSVRFAYCLRLRELDPTRSDTWLKVAIGIWILSALGGVIASAKGAHVVGVVETVGYPWISISRAPSQMAAAPHEPNRSFINASIRG
jgi:hypothetical protein